jgi:MFS family permease
MSLFERLRMFDALRQRDYLRFAIGQIISLVGTWIQRIAQDWLVLQLSGNSPVALGVASGLQFGPSLLAPWGGLVADRCDRRRLLMGTAGVMGACAAILGLLTLRGTVSLGTVYVLCAIVGLTAAVESPARHALVAELVPPATLPSAVAANSAMFNIAKIAGPAIAGLVVGEFGLGWAFLTNAVTFLAVIATLCSVRRTHPASKPAGRGGGFGWLRGRPELLIVLGLVASMSTLGLNFSITLPVLVRTTFHGGPTAYGLLTTTIACGAVLGAVLAAARSGRPSIRRLLGSALAFGVVEVLVGLTPNCPTAAVLLAPAGFLTLTCTTSANTILQLSVSPELRGRVMGLYTLALLGGAPIGGPLMGLLADWWGPRAPIVIGGLSVMFTASICAAAYHRVTHLDG